MGTGKTLTASGSVNDGNGGNNYAVTFVTDTTGQITAARITVTAATNTKTYDGTTTRRQRRPSPRAAWRTGDTAAFTETYDTKNVGTGKTLTASGFGQRRQRRQQLHRTRSCTMTTGVITARAHHGDGGRPTPRSTTARRRRRQCRRSPSGSLGTGDTAAFTETYDTKNVGTGKTLTADGIGQRRQRRQQLRRTRSCHDTTGEITAVPSR